MKKGLESIAALCYGNSAVNEGGCLKGEPYMNRQPNEKPITAAYERLSRDDAERETESVSIENQKIMLKDYAAKHNLSNVVHYTEMITLSLIQFNYSSNHLIIIIGIIKWLDVQIELYHKEKL